MQHGLTGSPKTNKGSACVDFESSVAFPDTCRRTLRKPCYLAVFSQIQQALISEGAKKGVELAHQGLWAGLLDWLSVSTPLCNATQSSEQAIV
jgi:hypothetical protein